MFKKIIGTIIVAGSITFMAGCSAPTTDTPVVTQTVTEKAQAQAQTPTNDQSTVDKIFLNAVRENISGGYDTTDSELISLGKQICTTLDAGSSVMDIINVSVDNIGPYNAGVLVGAAVGTYCPNNRGKVQEFLSEYSSATNS